MKPVYWIAFVFLTLIAACSYDCIRATPGITLVSFSPAETDTLIVRRFSRASNYATLVDSVLLTAANSSYMAGNDTTELNYSFGTDNGFVSNYDYEIYLPSVARLFRISDIQEPSQTMNQGLSCNKVACANSISSYRVNGQLVNAGMRQNFFLEK